MNLSGRKETTPSYLKLKSSAGANEILWGLIWISVGLHPMLSHYGVERPWSLFIGVVPAFLIYGSLQIFLVQKRVEIPGKAPARPTKTKYTPYIVIFFTALAGLTFIITLSGNFTMALNALGRISKILLLDVIFIALPISAAAFFLRLPRIYAIAFLYALAWPASELLKQPLGEPWNSLAAFGSTGLAVVFIGLIVMAGFIKRTKKINNI